MSTVLTLLRKDIRLFMRNKAAFSLTFIVPLVLVYIFGHVFGVTGGSSGPTGIRLAVVNASEADVATTIIDGLQQESAFRLVTHDVAEDGTETPLTEARVRELMRDNQLRFALIFPPDTISDETFGLKLHFLHNPRNDIESQTVNGLLQKVIFTHAPQALMSGMRKQAAAFIGETGTSEFYDRMAGVIADAFGEDRAAVKARLDAGDWFGSIPSGNPAPEVDPATGEPAPSTAAATSSFLDQIVRIESEQVAGAELKSPAATRVVGGWAIMFLLFSVSGASTSLFEEKKAGIFLRLLASPVRRSHILWSKYLFNVLMGLTQLTVLFLAGQVLFGIEVVPHLPALFVVALCASIACTAFGMLLAAVSSSPAAASGLATFLILTMSAIGGAWFPTSFMPEFMQSLSKLTLVYWSIEGFLGVLWARQPLVELAPVLGVLLGMAVVVNAVSLWRFNRGDLFD